jgi:branched-chain amino acid transport system substrate-binding protein
MCSEKVESGYRWILTLCAAILGVLCIQSIPVARAADPVTVAVAGPMIGTSFSVGVQYRVGVTAAINKTLPEGLLLGRKVEVIAHDDSCDDGIAESLARKMVQTPPAVVIGHSCSGATLAAAPVYARHKVLQITPASTNPQITEMGIKTLFRMIGRDDIQGEVAAERLATLHAGQKIGVLHFPGAYSKRLAETTIEALQLRGIKPARVIETLPESVSYATEIQALIDAGVEALYLVGGALDSAVFVRQARQMDARFQVISSDTLVSKVFVETAGDAAENIPFTFPPEAARLSTSAPAIAAINALGQEPAGYTLLAYAATQTWIEGVKRANSFNAEQVAAAIRREPLETILGPISFDSKGDIRTSYPPFSWYAWKGGKLVPLE